MADQEPVGADRATDQENDVEPDDAMEAVAELLGNSWESHWTGVGYLMALSKWQPELYQHAAERLLQTILFLLDSSNLVPPGLALAALDGVMPDPMPDRIVGARDCLQWLADLQANVDGPGMKQDGSQEYLIGFWAQAISLALQLKAEEEERERHRKAHQN